MSAIDYSQRIPNNVDLAGDRRLQRALEAWQPGFQRWWAELGPARHQDAPLEFEGENGGGLSLGHIGGHRCRTYWTYGSYMSHAL